MAGLAEVERKIVAGSSLYPHLSRSIRSPTFNDSLLNDWGIHHIHLGAEIGADGFAARSGPILFARFDHSSAYLIAVLPHGSWALQALVQVLHDNWPDSIAHHRLKGVLACGREFSDQDKARLRKANVNSMVQLGRGVVYAPIGGGFSTSGISTEVAIRSDYCARRLGMMQQALIDNIELIAASARREGVDLPWELQFKLKVESDVLSAIEVNSMVEVELGKI